MAALPCKERETDPQDECRQRNIDIIVRDDADHEEKDKELYAQVKPCRKVIRHILTPFPVWKSRPSVLSLPEAHPVIKKRIRQTDECENLQKDTVEHEADVNQDAPDFQKFIPMHDIA